MNLIYKIILILLLKTDYINLMHENSIHKLKPNGYFIIEDIIKSEEYLFENRNLNIKIVYLHY